MNRFIKISLLMLLYFVSSCSNVKFYKELSSAYSESYRKGNPVDKRILKALGESLKTSDHIIYIYMPNYSAMSLDTKCLIYDVDNKNYYEILLLDDLELELKKMDDLPKKETYYSFILKHYLKKDFEYLTDLHKKYFSSLPGTYNYVYDIDLKSKEYKEYKFINFVFYNGKLYDGMEPMDNDMDW